jgi:hypothetical protein
MLAGANMHPRRGKSIDTAFSQLAGAGGTTRAVRTALKRRCSPLQVPLGLRTRRLAEMTDDDDRRTQPVNRPARTQGPFASCGSSVF